MDDGGSDKKAKGTKKFALKRRLKFNDFKDCLLNDENDCIKIATKISE